MRERIDRIAEPRGDRTPYGPGRPRPVRDGRIVAARGRADDRADDRADRGRPGPEDPFGELLAPASRCHPQTLRQMRRTNTPTKTLAPQPLTAS
ncbi:hypothetical protein ACFC6L_26680 [Kitasatospora phosalacinea]|uniref:hypothetical protein n=1 Tax=Kitasatospora phosalacinea TaxID=2065 RepID=UPI0035E1A218